jgi:hypothetical protein
LIHICHPGLCLERLTKTTENFTHDSRFQKKISEAGIFQTRCKTFTRSIATNLRTELRIRAKGCTKYRHINGTLLLFFSLLAADESAKTSEYNNFLSNGVLNTSVMSMVLPPQAFEIPS